MNLIASHVYQATNIETTDPLGHWSDLDTALFGIGAWADATVPLHRIFNHTSCRSLSHGISSGRLVTHPATICCHVAAAGCLHEYLLESGGTKTSMLSRYLEEDRRLHVPAHEWMMQKTE